jgi:SPX domain protein involved in polyphosphate accumulation
MNNLSHLIRAFNRFELKYLISLHQAETFRRELLAYLVPDNHGGSEGMYTISSLYYDSPDHRCFWEKVDGIRWRRKLRIRYYESDKILTPDSLTFVEIKQRVDRVTQKRRVPLPYRAALSLCTDRQLPESVSQDAPVIQEVLALAWHYDLRPASLVRYTRQALVGTDYDIGLRVTFDTDLSYRTNHLNLGDWQDGLALFPPGMVVMEIKVNERIPYWLTEMVAAHNLRLSRISKYCRSIEMAQNLQVWSSAQVMV